ncbi:MAG: serine protein kinase PrkA, partial [Myxococcota bacterium]
RRAILAQAYAQQSIEEAPPEAVWSGELGQKNRMIFEALLTAYRGDLNRVLAHVQVERYYVSRRYRQAAVTIGPQMAVDASERQISADRTLASLPASLSALTLFEPYGELVDASGGIVEYSDLLKRPLDAWKYLLLAIEAGEVSLPFSNLPLNSVLIASSNELHLRAFREHPEYNSFRGRIHCVRVPYLTDFRREQSIYDAQIVPQIRRHVAPHTTFCAALWAVLTRLRRPNASRYDNSLLGRVAESLTPVEKAMLYAEGALPSRLDSEETKELQKGIGRIPTEFDAQQEYEGLLGASPREIRTLLLDTANEERDDCVAPPALLERIQAFCERNDREFLKQKQDNGYQDSAGFVAVVREKWLDLVDDELRDATGLIDEHQHRELFDRYVVHVSFWLKKERVYNSMTGTYEEADLELMENVEQRIGAGDKEEFRRTVMAKLAAHAIDNPGETPDHSDLFPQYLHKIRRSHYEERKKQVAEVAQALRSLLSDEPLHDEELRSSVDSALSVLLDRYGYERSSARIAVAALLDDRYLP